MNQHTRFLNENGSNCCQSKRLVQNFVQLETSRLLQAKGLTELSNNSSSWSASALYLPAAPPGQKDTLFKSHQISPVWLGKNFLRKFFLLNTEDWISDCMVTKTKTWCCALVACAGPFPRAGAPSIRGRSSGSRKGPWIKENDDFTMQGGEL